MLTAIDAHNQGYWRITKKIWLNSRDILALSFDLQACIKYM